MNRVLVSFQHSIAALIDRRVLLINCAVCEEMFQAVTELVDKKSSSDAMPEIAERHPAEVVGQLKDFPLMLRVVSLSDGVEILKPPEVIVKWSNIAAICNMSDEEWTAIKRPPRKRKSGANK